ncbi:AMP-binding protein [Jongsikchunia kroppenstedtii]|uniref:AMP-binding protein n=1 Tax=Jongsikchunia kroppenstedtii TaxID=1121721 RepID=UPI0003726ED3|nr:AMP-binding protein [Jongsikchunia kroppenstedtii]
MSDDIGATRTSSSELSRILDAAATAHPDRPAIVDGADALTYRRLHERVADLADRLRSAGVGRGDAVGVHLPRSATAIIAIHAVIATGAVVAPLDASDPSERTRLLCEQAGIVQMLVPAGAAADDSANGESVTAVGEGLALVRGADVSEARTTPFADPGYLLFTSGSTGVPKGVLLPSGAVAHFARWAAGSLGLQATDRVGAQAAFTFDLSTFDIFATAVVGATAVIFPEWCKPFPRDTVDWLDAQKITVLYAVPTLLKGIVGALVAERRELAELRAIAYAGEPYPAPALQELLAAFPSAQVRNWYGPTETNVCTAADVRGWTPGRPVPVGMPISGVHGCIVDEDLNPADVGELVVAGPTLLTGYVVDGSVVDPAVQVSFPDGEVRRAYRTGDRAYRNEAGELILLGRADRQIKRRGYRIDLTGIESIASEHGRAPGAAAVAIGDDNRIALFVDIDPAAPSASDVLVAVECAVRSRLPAAAQPDRIIAHSPLPTNGRGKIDRAELEDLAALTFTNQELSL